MATNVQPTLYDRFVAPASSICVITDFEPDDAIFILVLMQALRGSGKPVTFIVSGWTQQQPKAAVMATFLATYFPEMMPTLTIKLGQRSPTSYQLDLTPEQAQMQFDRYSEADLKHEVVFQLTHPYEIMDACSHQPDFFSKTHLFTYGSFNYRALIEKQQITGEGIAALFSHFAFTFYYEAFPVTNPTKMEYADLNHAICANYPLLAAHIKWWNELIVQECMETINSPTANPAAIDRCQQIVDSIHRCESQFLDADGGLLVTLLQVRVSDVDLVSGKYVYPAGGYPRFDDDHEGLPLNTNEVCHIRATDRDQYHRDHHAFYGRAFTS
jgi:hypothetical protein